MLAEKSFGLATLACSLALALGSSVTLGAASHPLDGLSADELSATITLLRDDNRLAEASRFPLMELVEPNKHDVLGWKPGDPITRTVRVIVKEGPKSFEGIVDLSSGKILSWQEAAGESMFMLEEFLGATDLALAHEDLVAGLGKRGLTPADVYCLPLTAGSFGTEDEQGRRLMKVPCYLLPSGSNFYARPIEGLFAVVDLNADEVVEVVDTGAVPLPADSWGYTEAEIAERYGSLRPKSNEALLQQPGGANFTIDGGQIEWDMWRFHYRVDKRPGLVLSLVQAKDRDS